MLVSVLYTGTDYIVEMGSGGCHGYSGSRCVDCITTLELSSSRAWSSILSIIGKIGDYRSHNLNIEQIKNYIDL